MHIVHVVNKTRPAMLPIGAGLGEGVGSKDELLSLAVKYLDSAYLQRVPYCLRRRSRSRTVS